MVPLSPRRHPQFVKQSPVLRFTWDSPTAYYFFGNTATENPEVYLQSCCSTGESDETFILLFKEGVRHDMTMCNCEDKDPSPFTLQISCPSLPRQSEAHHSLNNIPTDLFQVYTSMLWNYPYEVAELHPELFLSFSLWRHSTWSGTPSKRAAFWGKNIRISPKNFWKISENTFKQKKCFASL